MRHPFRSTSVATPADQCTSDEDGAWPRATSQDLVVDPAQFSRLNAATAFRWGVAPLRWQDNALIVAVPDSLEGGELTLHARLERNCGCRVELRLASPGAIQTALRQAEAEVSALQDLSGEMSAPRRETGESGPTPSLQSLHEVAHPVVRLIDTLLLGALARRASDIHLEAYERGVLAKYRIDGVLYPAMDWIDAAYHAALTARLKVMAELDIAERRVPQDGRFSVRLADREVDCRLSVLPAVHGEDVVIRLLDKTAVVSGNERLSLDALGLSPVVVKRLRKAVREPYGMVLMTGPTGSGNEPATLKDPDGRMAWCAAGLAIPVVGTVAAGGCWAVSAVVAVGIGYFGAKAAVQTSKAIRHRPWKGAVFNEAGDGVGSGVVPSERPRGLPPEGVSPPVDGEVKPGPASRPSERDKGGQSLWDDKGGEWRWFPGDRWHNPHWDHNPHDKPSSPWINVDHGGVPSVKPVPDPKVQ